MPQSLEKMRITAYSDPEYNDPVRDGKMEVQINPESYTFTYGIQQNESQAPGTSNTPSRFVAIRPSELEFEFLFDSTGALPRNQGTPSREQEADDKGVTEEIYRFRNIAIDYQGDTHRPNFLELIWGKLVFKGTLSEMNVVFTLFRPNGTPVRATVRAKFVGTINDDLRVAQEDAQSADLTHFRTVYSGEHLSGLAHEIYGDAGTYLAIARINRLTSLRTLREGTILRFPPAAELENHAE